MCFFVFLKFPMSFDYSVNVFKKILKKYPRDRIYVKNPLSKDILTAWAPWQWETVLFFCVLYRRGSLSSSLGT